MSAESDKGGKEVPITVAYACGGMDDPTRHYIEKDFTVGGNNPNPPPTVFCEEHQRTAVLYDTHNRSNPFNFGLPRGRN